MSAIDIPVGSKGLSRRQALKVVAAAAAVPAVISGVRFLAPKARFHTWNGEALGAVSSMTIWHPNADFAQQTMRRMLTKVARLESVFSLFRPESELSRLNKESLIRNPSRDLVTVMEAARGIGAASNGAFDPTVQRLWDLYARYFSVDYANPAGPPAADIESARRMVDYRRIDVAQNEVRFTTPGMSATLNGIAQGYITDRITDLLRNEGFEHVVIELGETRVLGDHPDGGPWQVALRDQDGSTDRKVYISDGALAMSGGYGTVFDPSGHNHHLFDPSTGYSANRLHDVVVQSPRAMEADALATALFVAGEAMAPAILANYPGATAMLTRPDGTAINL
jgi:thiamine biosynthesis lipoprotein